VAWGVREGGHGQKTQGTIVLEGYRQKRGWYDCVGQHGLAMLTFLEMFWDAKTMA